jgi:hypothetical protein
VILHFAPPQNAGFAFVRLVARFRALSFHGGTKVVVRILPVLASDETFSAIVDITPELTNRLIDDGTIPTIQFSGLRRVKVKEALAALCNVSFSREAQSNG